MSLRSALRTVSRVVTAPVVSSTHAQPRLPSLVTAWAPPRTPWQSNFFSTSAKTLRSTPEAAAETAKSAAETAKSAASAAEAVPEPTKSQLFTVFMQRAMPMIGFGFIDNVIMILGGDSIDRSIGTFMAVSALACAGLGNMLSDVVGMGMAGTIEEGARRLGIDPKLTPKQLKLSKVTTTGFIGASVGVGLGCLIGMFPLIWMDPDASAERKRRAAQRERFKLILKEVTDEIGAERATLWLVQKEENELMAFTDADGGFAEVRVGLEQGVVGAAVKANALENVKDTDKDKRVMKKLPASEGKEPFIIKNMLVMPFVNTGGDVIGAVQVLNKLPSDEASKKKKVYFDDADESKLRGMCGPISIAVETKLPEGAVSETALLEMLHTAARQHK
mmetsp:Transcript_18587/g.22265  ORF Transcript_18587/g.22265 Transcript_18587/m.22265 type:complete len:390 (+) Transcript_18587:136-1305(+)|eukprot:CAMPEP_0197866820 /NCGR_PEP_ID=MMETSP1438-20131217/44419_1 /TAXON_ID=1461541 /ORGANISM="Pterosperma sp., Strain CCMP1384" /LENGTH=389 /DNA_ID=CAMNT_0043485415 /DNA_START=127 /DNA_END=1296 /DNA_ORIENTATION=+